MTTTAKYRIYLKSFEWDQRRREALRLASYRCQRCGKAKPLQVHHLTYERIFNEQMDDLQAVCDQCHRWLHGIKPWWAKGFMVLWKGIRWGLKQCIALTVA